MAVYVDDMKERFGRMIMCHMMADTAEELHAMADKIGISREHFQGDHYDVCQSKYTLAVRHGAKHVYRRDMIRIRTAFREAQRGVTVTRPDRGGVA